MGLAWRCIAESLRGPSHAADGMPCQDASAVRLLGEGDAECLIACIADGAGSASHSHLGSAEACRSVIDDATAFFTEHQGFASLKFEDARALIEQARHRVLTLATQHELSPREFATTLLVVIASPERTFFFQVGDGAMILGRQGLCGVVFWPQSGEYANTTNFLTGPNFDDQLEFAMTSRPVDELAMFTDGLERLALVFDTQTPHEPFCRPLFNGLRVAENADQLSGDLREFLDSESVRQRSDDDKSLILASRCEAP